MTIKREVNGQMMEFELTANELWLAHTQANNMDMNDRLNDWMESHKEDYDGEGLTEPSEEEREEIIERYAEKLEDFLSYNWEDLMEESYTWVMI